MNILGLKLIIDIGNTRTKLAVFHENNLIDLQVSERPELVFLNKVLMTYPDVSASVLSSVRDYPIEFDTLLKRVGFFLKINAEILLPFKNLYQTPQSLGKDRLAIVAGAKARFPQENVLAIDAGTTITYDFINKNGEYLGGGISPGIVMRLKALHTFTDKLPFISSMEMKIPLIGNTTKMAILSGVMNGVVVELDGIIDRYKQQFNGLKIIMGGGDHKYFDTRVKNNIFASPNIVLEGLKEILDFNEEI